MMPPSEEANDDEPNESHQQAEESEGSCLKTRLIAREGYNHDDNASDAEQG